LGIGTTNFKHHFATKHQDGIGKQMEFIKLGLKQQLFTKLVTMKFRIARHTTDLNRIIDFYGRILGLKVLGEFKAKPGTWSLRYLIPPQSISPMTMICWFFMLPRWKNLRQ